MVQMELHTKAKSQYQNSWYLDMQIPVENNCMWLVVLLNVRSPAAASETD